MVAQAPEEAATWEGVCISICVKQFTSREVIWKRTCGERVVAGGVAAHGLLDDLIGCEVDGVRGSWYFTSAIATFLLQHEYMFCAVLTSA